MNAQTLVLYVLAVMAGILGGVHLPINGAMGVRIHSVLVATFIFYGVGFLLIALVCAVTYDRAAFAALATVPKWYFAAGIISVLVVTANTFLIPRLGALKVFVIVLSFQLISRTVIANYGLLSSPLNTITTMRVLGCLLLLTGAVLVVRF